MTRDKIDLLQALSGELDPDGDSASCELDLRLLDAEMVGVDTAGDH